MSQHSKIFCWIPLHWLNRVRVSIYRLTPPVFVHPTVGPPAGGRESPHPDEAPELGYGVPGAPRHPAVRLTAGLQSLRVEAEGLQLPAGAPQSQEMTLTPVLHLALNTATALTAGLPQLPQLQSLALPAGSLAVDEVTPPVSRPPEMWRLRLTAALSVASRVDQQLLA